MRTAVAILFVLAQSASAAASVEPPAAAPPAAPTPLTAVDFSAYKYDPAKDLAVKTGERFMADLCAKDGPLCAAVTEKVRYDIQDVETKKLMRQSKFVLGAYAVLWLILIGFAVGMWQKQRKLTAELAALEARLKKP